MNSTPAHDFRWKADTVIPHFVYSGFLLLTSHAPSESG